MSRISIGHLPPRPCTGKKTLRRCRNNDQADGVILIDVDSEYIDNVIILDTPDSLPKKNHGSSRLGKDMWPFRNVINIDDDETPESSPFIDVKNVSSCAGTSSNRESSRIAQNFGDSSTPVRLSKCKRTYSGKNFRKNRYGLDTDSECDSSDNDYPDCEIVEDSSGKVQEQWEKAFSRRKKVSHNGNSGSSDHDSTSHFVNKDNQQNAESKDETRQHKEDSSCFTSGKSNNEDVASSPFRTKEGTDFGFPHSDKQNKKSDACSRSNSQDKCRPTHVEHADCMDSGPGCSGSHIEERKKYSASSNFASQGEPTKGFGHAMPIVEDEETSEVGPCPLKPDLFVDKDSCNGKSSPMEGNPTICKSTTAGVEERDPLRYRHSHATRGAKKMGNLMPERCLFERSTLPDKQPDLSTSPSSNAVDGSGKSSSSKNVLHPGERDKANHKGTRPLVPEIPLFGNIHLNEAKLQEDNATSNMEQQENKDAQLHSQNGDACFPEETFLISEREKLKETEEYKRAEEVEWASRQQALQIQAEEARHLRRLRKRRKAESMRLLDMERRQKERIEEMRNIQKKDEENMNLKETIRGEVRNDLKKLEILCKNMAMLLQSLGIRVGSWPNPSPQEVQAAYKRALLTFHPDRAPQSDIRHQVEAEEKFKLINRLKEKLPPS